MHGVIAAGSDPTADAGAEILAAGGNAADAAVAACFATASGEPTLTSLAGGGIMTYRDAASGKVTVCDFFSDAPRLHRDRVAQLDFEPMDLDFGPTTQRFYIGAGSAAVPGVIPGLCSVLDRYGSMPLARVIEPACKFMRDGVTLGPYQGCAAKLLEPILTHTESARAIFAPTGRMIGEGDVFRLPQLADTLEAMAREGWQRFYRHELGQAMIDQFGPDSGGMITAEDLDNYQVIFREPLGLQYRDVQVLTNPPPAAGGPMIALMLRLLAHADLSSCAPGGTAEARMLCHAMAVADEARNDDLAAALGSSFAHWSELFRERIKQPTLPAPASQKERPCTTHISVLDQKGNAAAVTFSFGEGNAHVIDNSGIVMNNLMGEEDLFPKGFGAAPTGERLNTMMAPTLLLAQDGGVTVLGTGGANRIRTAIVQVIANLRSHGMSAQDAIAAPRVHFENGVLNAEIFSRPASEELAQLKPQELIRFEEPNLFFGGVHLVTQNAAGQLAGAGDPRRGGACRVV